MSQRELNRHFFYKLTLNREMLEKPLIIIIFINDKLVAPQSEQMKHKKCCHCLRRRMPAVWERGCVRQLCRNPLTTDFAQAFQNNNNKNKIKNQMLCNEISPLVSQVIPSHCVKSHYFFDTRDGIYSVNVFPS